MSDVLFLLRVTVVTVIVVIVMQVKVGEQTLEERAHRWTTNTRVVQILQEVADGAVLLLAEGYQKITLAMTDRFQEKVNKEDQPGFRTMKLHIQRGGAYLKKQTDELVENINAEEIPRREESTGY